MLERDVGTVGAAGGLEKLYGPSLGNTQARSGPRIPGESEEGPLGEICIDDDQLFDMDLALTMPENPIMEMNNEQVNGQSTAKAVVEEMATVVTECGGGGLTCRVCMDRRGLNLV
ncbi:hypothetical protein BUALT_Bualt09G0024400 [Buddleja alternifolia]|uniref:Uncharacterized protein n=1 Tax=Buddleja alternifolia TaxID=168488 RepID=A0AAV6WYK6_9LAMI|nr:hypothetical protein BUALT_Bualt09G0024400 [Buddleja alternifolia]